MTDKISREDVLKVLENVEHPEIGETLINLGMIIDAAVQDKTVKVAMALPALSIPDEVRNILVETISKPIEELGLKMEVEYFLMSPEVRDNFMAAVRAKWKGSV
jgi:metal-sulfur cluster biosynthetic enzyme